MNVRWTLALLAALLPIATFAQDAAAIAAGLTPVAIAVGDLDHPAWEAAPASRIKLETAFPGHPSISGSAVAQSAAVRALRSPTGLLVRIEWNDPVADTQKTQDRFADGVAIQFPHDGKASTLPFMGGGGQTVNIWYWNAARNAAENLWADGFGSLARLPVQDVKAYGRHRDGKWQVAFYRAFRSAEPKAGKLSPTPAARQPIAFAVWDGRNNERDGFKAVTMSWQSLRWAQ